VTRKVRRRRAAVAGVMLALMVVVVVAVVGGLWTTTATRPTATDHGRTATIPSGPTSSSTSTATPAGSGPYPVGSLSITVTEPATASRPARTLTTYVRYPAVPGTGGPQTPPVPARDAGPFPLVVFSGGYAVSPEEYSTLLTAWAAAGYVVADPVYPSTTPSSPGGLDETDIVHHPGDLSAVITALLDADSTTGSASPGASEVVTAGPVGTLAGLIASGEIAAIGHSDGGDVTLAAVAGSCCQDRRIRAAVVLSGAEYAAFGGTYFAAPEAGPLLVVQGTADTINPEGCSVQLYDQAPQPKDYLSLVDQTHQGPYLEEGPALTTVTLVTTDFLNWALRGSKAAVAAMSAAGDVSGRSTLFVGAPTGLPPDPCPGAPGA
jgi:predicted dienelactone hydrolase